MKFIIKHKKCIIIVTSVVLSVFIVVQVFYWLINSPFIIPMNKMNSPTKSELIDLYWENKDNLNEVAEIILANDSFLQKIKNGYEGEGGIFTKSDKEHFSEDEWKKVVETFETFGPYMVMRSFSDGYDVVYFSFKKREEAGQWVNNNLYCFKDLEAAECYKDYIWVGELEHIDGYWYVD